jgi:hypothetical protein
MKYSILPSVLFLCVIVCSCFNRPSPYKDNVAAVSFSIESADTPQFEELKKALEERLDKNGIFIDSFSASDDHKNISLKVSDFDSYDRLVSCFQIRRLYFRVENKSGMSTYELNDKIRTINTYEDKGIQFLCFNLNSGSVQSFYEYSSANLNKQMEIMLDDKMLFSASVREAINKGSMCLSSVSEQETKVLKNLTFILKTNKLPFRLINLKIDVVSHKD